jgi:hypothetical protein
MCVYLQKGQIRIFREAFFQEQEREKRPGIKATIRVPTKVPFEKHCNLCKKHGGAYTTHNTRECDRFEKEGKDKSDFRTDKKGGKKVNHNFAQLTEKIEKLKKALKKSGKKGKKCCYKDSNSNSE